MTVNFNQIPAYIRREIGPPSSPVSEGARNDTVERIQEWLNYHNCRTGIDGKFGPATASCVKDFQRRHDLPANGKVNKATWDTLVAPMRAALHDPGEIGGLTPGAVLRAVAIQHVDQHPLEIGGPNEGPWVRLYCEGNDGLPWAWCAGFVSLIMQQAFFYQGIKAPIKGSVSCDSLAAQAKTAGRFVSGRAIARGDVSWESLGECSIFLKRRTSTDWTHAGFALDASGQRKTLVFSTIEGNTNDEGIREGFEACRRTRGLGAGNYDFISFAQP